VRDDHLEMSDLQALGLGSLGRDVHISRHALLLSPERIHVGDHSRIDAFCILSPGDPGITIGRNVHISAYSAILGGAGVTIGDFATISARCTVLSSNDDYSGESMANATIPAAYRGAVSAPVLIARHALIGAGTIVLPGVTVNESGCVGAMSLVNEDVGPLQIVAGVPARVIGMRSARHQDLARTLVRDEATRS
jgi:acetyltransferase-like isoleucine patch superfamily enzyme